MFCRICGKDIPKNSIFCPYCGAKVEKVSNKRRERKNTKEDKIKVKEREKKDLDKVESRKNKENAKKIEKVIKKEKQREKSKRTIFVVFGCAFIMVLVFVFLIPKIRLNNAMELIDSEDYDRAYGILEDIGKEELIIENKYNRAMSLIESEQYELAYSLLEEINRDDVISENKYNRATKLIESKNYDEAISLLEGLEYKDSEDILQIVSIKKKLANVNVGEIIAFGSYEQDNNLDNGKEDIEWQVLKIEDGKILVVSKFALDAKPFNESGSRTTWENSSIRAWLNDSFLKEAFNNNEQVMLYEVDNSDLEGYEVKDKVFLLSRSEAENYMPSYRLCFPTEYAKNQGAMCIFGRSIWWLRSISSWCADQVNYDGGINTYGMYAAYGNTDFTIRPALWIEL